MPRDIHDHLPRNPTATAKEKEPGALLTGVSDAGAASAGVMTVNIEDLVASKSLHPKLEGLQKSQEPIVNNGALKRSTNTITELAGNARYSNVAEYRFTLKSTEGARYNVDLLPTNTTAKVNVKATVYYGTDETVIPESEKGKLRDEAILFKQAIDAGQANIHARSESGASDTYFNPQKKDSYNQGLSDKRNQVTLEEFNRQAVGQGVSEDKLSHNVSFEQKSNGNKNLPVNTHGEERLNRYGAITIPGLEIKKGTYHEIVITPENATDINYNARANGSFTISWPKKGPENTHVAGNPIKEESIAASIRFENAFIMDKNAPIPLKGITNLENVKIVVDTESMPKDAQLSMGVSNFGQNTLYLTQNGKMRELAAFPIVDDNGVPAKLGLIKNVVWRDPKGREYENYNGLPLERVIELNNIKQGALDAFKKADINQDGMLKGQELVDFKLGKPEVMKIIDRAEGLKISYDANHHVSEIDLVSPTDGGLTAKAGTPNLQKR